MMAQQPVGQNAAHPSVAYMVAQQSASSAIGYNQPLPLVVQIPREYSQNDAKKATAMGIVQLVAGCLCIIFQAAATSISWRAARFLKNASWYGVDSAVGGVWCGIMFLIAGILGICAGKKNKLGLIVASMVFNIICSGFGMVLLSFGAASLGVLNACWNDGVADWYYTTDTGRGYNSGYYTTYPSMQYHRYYCSDPLFSTWMAMDVLLIVLAVTEIAVAVAASAYCCKATGCCCCQATPRYIVNQTYLPADVHVQSLSPQPPMAVPYGYVSQGYPVGVNIQHSAATAANAVGGPPYERLHEPSATTLDSAISYSDLAPILA